MLNLLLIESILGKPEYCLVCTVTKSVLCWFHSLFEHKEIITLAMNATYKGRNEELSKKV